MDRLSVLADAFRLNEGPNTRGPQFVQLALGIESAMKECAVTKEELISLLGPPDLFDANGEDATYVYRFDHSEPGRNQDEWYFHIKNGRLIKSGYNQAGINDLSNLKLGSEFHS